MKSIFMLSMIIIFMVCVCSCTKNKRVYDGIFRGIYEGSSQAQEMKTPDKTPPQVEKPPTYDQYKRERQEIMDKETHKLHSCRAYHHNIKG